MASSKAIALLAASARLAVSFLEVIHCLLWSARLQGHALALETRGSRAAAVAFGQGLRSMGPAQAK
jgi:hypothetical protein